MVVVQILGGGNCNGATLGGGVTLYLRIEYLLTACFVEFIFVNTNESNNKS